MIKRRSVAKRGADASRPRGHGHGLRLGGANRRPAVRTRDAREPARRPIAPTHQPFVRTPPRRGAEGQRDGLRIGDEVALAAELDPAYRMGAGARASEVGHAGRLHARAADVRLAGIAQLAQRQSVQVMPYPEGCQPAIVASTSCRLRSPVAGADPPEGCRCAARTRCR